MQQDVTHKFNPEVMDMSLGTRFPIKKKSVGNEVSLGTEVTQNCLAQTYLEMTFQQFLIFRKPCFSFRR